MAHLVPWGLVDAAPILRRTGPGDVAAVAVASAQHGAIGTKQLHYVGIGPDAIALRARNGRLTRLHQGVYVVGHRAITAIGQLAAAVLAVEGCVLSHRSAAFLWGLLAFGAGPHHVTSGSGHPRNRPLIVVHRARQVHRYDVRRRSMIPVTSPALTILGLAETEGSRVAEEALNEAKLRKLIRRNELVALKARTPGRRGWRELDHLLRLDGSDDFNRQKAEKVLIGLIRRARLPLPRRNMLVGGHELDFYWPQLRLNVEMDGYQWHSARHSVERDRDRDTELAALGIQVVRFAYGQLREPPVVVARLAAAVALATQAASLRNGVL